MMALYFTSVAMGTVLSGWLAPFYSMETEVPYFTWMGIITIATGILLFLVHKPVPEDDARREVATKLLACTADSLFQAA